MSIKNKQQKIKIKERKNKTPSHKKQVTKNHKKVRRGGEVIAFWILYLTDTQCKDEESMKYV